jgi:predicted transposase YdaD
VQSVVILLRKQADVRGLTGLVEYGPFPERGSLRFHFEVVRLWEQPVETLLAGGAGTLPLAPLAAIPRRDVRQVVQQMEERIEQCATPGEAAGIWASTYILMGLRYSTDEAQRLLHGVPAMRESTTYQAILREGRAEGRADGARELLLRMGEQRFGTPSGSVLREIKSIESVERLDELGLRLMRVNSWEELLAGG